jgi:serine/threonine-protein phosphatase 2A regulatory subunit A
VNGQVVKECIVPTTLSLGSDLIPNIRLNVAKALGVAVAIMKQADLGKAAEDLIKPVLNKMKDDPDMDVRFFANKSLTVF